jgi:hypothetical protein
MTKPSLSSLQTWVTKVPRRMSTTCSPKDGCPLLTLQVVKLSAYKGYKDDKDGLQPETLADGNWLVKQNQPVSKV